VQKSRFSFENPTPTRSGIQPSAPATLLSARKIIEVIDNDEPQNIGLKFWMDQFVSKAIDQVAAMLKKIDERWPAET
jgi:hypothetical protein